MPSVYIGTALASATAERCTGEREKGEREQLSLLPKRSESAARIAGCIAVIAAAWLLTSGGAESVVRRAASGEVDEPGLSAISALCITSCPNQCLLHTSSSTSTWRRRPTDARLCIASDTVQNLCSTSSLDISAKMMGRHT